MSDNISPLLQQNAQEAETAALLARLAARKTRKTPLDVAGAVVKDVGKGVVETPMAVVSGVRDAIQETIDLGAHLDKKTASLLGAWPGLQITDPDTGEFSPKLVNLAEGGGAENLVREGEGTTGLQLPDVKKPESTTGAFVEGAAQFLAGFAGAGKALKAGNVLQGLGKGSFAARGAVQGALSDFAVFDPQEERLSNLVEKVPGLSNPVTQYLSAQSDDGEIEGRIKNVLEGAGLGVATEGLLLGLRSMRKVRSAKRSIDEALSESAELTADRIRGEQVAKDFDDVVGSLESPLFDVKLDDAAKVTSDGATEFSALSEAATRWRDAVQKIQPDRFKGEGDLRALDGVDFNDVDNIMAMVDVVRNAPPEPQRLSQFVAEFGGLKPDKNGSLEAMMGQSKLSLDKSGNINPRGKSRVLHDGGRDIDEVIDAAWEAGYFHNTIVGTQLSEGGLRPSHDDLIELLRRDIQGEAPAYRDIDLEEVSSLQAARQAEEALDGLGVNWNDTSRKRVREQIEKVAALQGNPNAADFKLRPANDEFSGIRPESGKFSDLSTADIAAEAGEDGSSARNFFIDMGVDDLPEAQVRKIWGMTDAQKSDLITGEMERLANDGFFIQALADDFRVSKLEGGKFVPAGHLVNTDKLNAAQFNETMGRTLSVQDFNARFEKAFDRANAGAEFKARPISGLRTEADLAKEHAERTVAGANFLSVRQRADLGGQEIFVNFGKINSADDVKSVIGQMVDAFADDVNKARGGARVSVRQQKLSAQQLDAFEVLASRRKGDPLNASQSIAVRELWAASGAKLREAALAAHRTPTPGAVLAFRKMMAVHHAIQREVISARTETARALQIWSVPVGDTARMAQAVDDILAKNGGLDASAKLARQLSELGPNQAREFDQIIERSAMAKTADALAEAWRGGLLSAPQTHVVNAMGNTITMLGELSDRAVAAQVGRLLGEQGHSVQVGEAAAMAQGMLAGARDTFRYASKVLRGQTPDPGDFKIVTDGMGRADAPRVGSISSEAFNIDSATPLGKTVDALGTIIRSPLSALGASDTFFKTVNWRGEVYAQAHRLAMQEVNAGALAKTDIAARIADIVDNPPGDILLAARKAAQDRTFTTPPGEITRGILKFRDNVRIGPVPAGHILLPFVNTPANIMKYAFLRTPVAPLFAEYRAAMNAGGAAQELAITRMMSGSMIGLMAADYAMNGQISGAGPIDTRQRENLRRSGWQPYSVRVGDRWYAYNRLDPLGMTLGLGADAAEIFANTDWTDQTAEEADEVFALMAGSIGSVVLSKTYLQGVSDFTEFMSDPKRYGVGYLERLSSTFAVPAVVAQARRVEDPVIRDVASVVDAIKNRVPGLSKTLPAKLDLWGREVSYQSGLGIAYDAFSPIYSRKADAEPVDSEMVRLRSSLAMPRKAIDIGGVSVSLRNEREIYNRYVALAGNELKDENGMGAKDTINAILLGDHPQSRLYQSLSDGPDGGKSEMIGKIVTTYREAAKAKLLQEHPELLREAERLMREQAGL